MEIWGQVGVAVGMEIGGRWVQLGGGGWSGDRATGWWRWEGGWR